MPCLWWWKSFETMVLGLARSEQRPHMRLSTKGIHMHGNDRSCDEKYDFPKLKSVFLIVWCTYPWTLNKRYDDDNMRLYHIEYDSNDDVVKKNAKQRKYKEKIEVNKLFF